MQAPEIYAIIMAGGSGTRFWPASRRDRPKQYLKISGGLPMLAETWSRLGGLVPPERVLVVTTADQVAEVQASLPELPPLNILAEPEARNTGPCVALAAFEVAHRSPDSIQLVLPADHVIRPKEAFHRTVNAAASEANLRGSLIVFGIKPTWPATGFGYIEAGEVVRDVDGLPVHRVKRFVEKPDPVRAQNFLSEGGFYWNAGIFVWHTDAILRAVEKHMPQAHASLSKVKKGADLSEVYREIPAKSVDVAILEQAKNVRMLPVDYFWSDVGSWDALSDVQEKDANENVTSGGTELIADDARDCIVHGDPGEITALIGVSDLIVVHSGNATLVCHRDRAQDVKRLVERLQAEGRSFL